MQLYTRHKQHDVKMNPEQWILNVPELHIGYTGNYGMILNIESISQQLNTTPNDILLYMTRILNAQQYSTKFKLIHSLKSEKEYNKAFLSFIMNRTLCEKHRLMFSETKKDK